MSIHRCLTAAMLVSVAFASFTLAAPPTDEQIDAAIAKVDTAVAEAKDSVTKRQARIDAIKEAMDEISITDATVAQLKKLNDKRITIGNSELTKQVDDRLATLAKASTVEGAAAAELRIAIVPPAESKDARPARDAKVAELADAMLKHPGAADLFKTGGGEIALRSISGLPATLVSERHLIEQLGAHLTTDLPPTTTASLAGVVTAMVGMRDTMDKEKFEAMRKSIVSATDAAAVKATRLRDEHAATRAAATKKEGEEGEKQAKEAEVAARLDDSLVNRLKDVRALAAGAWARGELVDHPAPPIAFTWSNTEQPIHSFADLKGKVVLVDFWATWCGPCVAAFPKMRELQTRYAGYPVVILGVTSVQGYSIDRSNPKKPVKVDCKGDAAKEMDLMKSFTKDMEMTWNVAFSEQNVFNPDFGVRGIPSVAIIGPDGNVRFAGLYPNPKEEAEKIDGLLKEAKLPCPEAPYVEPKKETAAEAPKKG